MVHQSSRLYQGLVRLKELRERGGRKVAEGNNTTIKLTDQQTNKKEGKKAWSGCHCSSLWHLKVIKPGVNTQTSSTLQFFLIHTGVNTQTSSTLQFFLIHTLSSGLKLTFTYRAGCGIFMRSFQTHKDCETERESEGGGGILNWQSMMHSCHNQVSLSLVSAQTPAVCFFFFVCVCVFNSADRCHYRAIFKPVC